ncbi:MAG TPA: hypothetical protein VFS24_11015, partial [Steroidobacteraceae bacterium]|nr:hypothetical protein [Steroidobacteraceae bacterium]
MIRNLRVHGDIHVYLPHALIGKRATFYGILQRHQQRSIIAKIQIRARQNCMIWKRMLDDLHAGRSQ